MFNNIQVFVKGIVIDENNNHVVMLSDKEETKVLPIVIGPVEAMAILMNMQGITPNRPLTHNLLKNLLDLLGQSRANNHNEYKGQRLLCKLIHKAR